MTIALPPWFLRLDYNCPRQRPIRNRFLIKTAALYFKPNGSLSELANKIGVPYSTLASGGSSFHGIIPENVALKIENLLGATVMPRSLMRPDLYK